MIGQQAGSTGVAWTAQLTPVAGGLAVAGASTALAGVVTGLQWLLYATVAITVATGTGMALRSVRMPALVVGLGQLFTLACLLVTLFTRTGVLVVLPGPMALNDLATTLQQSVAEVQTGIAPVRASTAILCLITVTIGLVAAVVDALAVAAEAPAASGLMLLCVFAVPAALSEHLLPWWTFALGASAFALLLAVDGQRRHQAWRGRLGLPATGHRAGSGGSATVVTSLAVVLALLCGAWMTMVGTAGHLPGMGSGNGSGGRSNSLGIKPFTSLTGMLDRRDIKELFKVRGLTTQSYLRAMTMGKYTADQGWGLAGPMPAGNPAKGVLPLAAGDSGAGSTTRVEIEPVGWGDVWEPVYGLPRKVDGLPDGWRYDTGTGAVYSERPPQTGKYTVEAVLTPPTRAELRSATGLADIDPVYTERPQVAPEVTKLVGRITDGADSDFDRAAAIWGYFTNPANGFTYSLNAQVPVGQDKLSYFLFNGKTGYCEQYASAMAVMLREAGVPTRVAAGFTAGVLLDDVRTITSQDAHAWVEAYFPGYGWITFDPTPLSGGRAVTQPYLNSDQPTVPGGRPDGGVDRSSVGAGASSAAAAAPPTAKNPVGDPHQRDNSAWSTLHHGITLLLAVLGGLCTLASWASRRAPNPSDRHTGARGTSRFWHRIRESEWMRFAGPLAVSCWVLAAVSLVGYLSWWLALPLLLIVGVAAPALARTVRRRQRLRVVARASVGAAGAAWEELLAESWDRGTSIPRSDTIRTAARRLVREHGLDEEGRDGLRSVVGAVERSWYGDGSAGDRDLPSALDTVRQSLHRNAPLALKARMLPRSVLHPTRPRR